jgi:hypothetical protein
MSPNEYHNTKFAITLIEGFVLLFHVPGLRGHQISHPFSNSSEGGICRLELPDITELLQKIMDSTDHIGEIMNLSKWQQIPK